MAKKIRLDFSKVEERSGYNSRQMPEGLYEAKVSGLEQREAQDGTDMLVYGLRPTAKKYSTRNFPHFCKIQPNQLWKLRDLLVAAGETVPKKSQNIDPEKVIGKIVVIEIGDGTGQYSDRSEVINVYPISALEDTDEGDDEEEYEDEEDTDDEYEDDESDSDEDDEEYEDDEDESDEEFEDDDEDLDEDEDEDEDLDDEDLEDEDDEEEEEPAPKRPARKAAVKKPAKAPVKAAAKKPAAKAPAKRVVKRSR